MIDAVGSMPERALSLQGVSNFRDLGGYTGRDGRPVRWRRLFRSAHLGELTASDITLLAGLGVRRVFDFRGVDERGGAPCALPDAEVHSLAIEPSVVQRMSEHLAKGEALTGSQMVAYMQQTYRDFVHNNTPCFAQLMSHALASDAPLVFHCTAGKDRTGFAASMLLMALGVSREQVVEDYLLTNRLLRRKLHVGGLLPPEARAILEGVQIEFLDAALDVVAQEYGGVDSYLTHQLGLGHAERRRLDELYLQG